MPWRGDTSAQRNDWQDKDWVCLPRPAWVTVSKWERSLLTFGGELKGSDWKSQQYYIEKSWKNQDAEEVNLNSGRESWKVWEVRPQLWLNLTLSRKLRTERKHYSFTKHNQDSWRKVKGFLRSAWNKNGRHFES